MGFPQLFPIKHTSAVTQIAWPASITTWSALSVTLQAGFYLDPTSGTCYGVSVAPLMLAGYGANTAAGTMVACSTAHCSLCRATYTTCTGCLAGYTLSGNTCTAPSGCSTGQGYNGGVLQACSDTHCSDCCAVYTNCVACTTTSGWYLKQSTSQCQSAGTSPTMANGFGPDTSTGGSTNGTVLPCSDVNCLHCTSVYTTCTGCNTGAGWYLNGNQCQSAASSPLIPSGYGANTGTGMVVVCTDVHCTSCAASYLTCLACDVANGWYLNGNLVQSPTNSPLIPAGFGPDILSGNTTYGQVLACLDPHCLICQSDHSVCTSCPATGSPLTELAFSTIVLQVKETTPLTISILAPIPTALFAVQTISTAGPVTWPMDGMWI